MREWESHPPEEVYEASLRALVEFPAVEIGGVGGYRALINLLAGQVHYLSATTPLASRPGAAPGRLSFGDSAAQAGARPIQVES